MRSRWANPSILLVLACISSPCSLMAEAQYTREIIEAPEQEPITVQEDGTTVLAGTGLPEFLTVQNFLIKAHVASQSPERWQGFLAEIGLSPHSAAADALRRAAGEILAVAEDIQVSHDPDVRAESLRAVRRLAALWRGIQTAEPRSPGSASTLQEYMDTNARRHGKLVISPESVPDMPFLYELQDEFEREVAG